MVFTFSLKLDEDFNHIKYYIMSLGKRGVKTLDFCSFIRSPSQGLFDKSDLFLFGEGFSD